MDVLLIQNGVVENVISADSVARAQQYFPAFTCIERTVGMVAAPGYTTTDNVTFTPPTPPQTWVITKFSLLARFQPSEAIALNVAAQGTGTSAATMQYYLSALNAAAYVNLQDPQTVGMIDALVTAGILTQARATQILTTPAASNELPGGV